MQLGKRNNLYFVLLSLLSYFVIVSTVSFARHPLIHENYTRITKQVFQSSKQQVIANINHHKFESGIHRVRPYPPMKLRLLPRI